MSSLLKETYEKRAEYSAFYTGGDIQWSRDGGTLFCQCDDVIKVIDVNTCSDTLIIGDTDTNTETDNLYTFAISNDCKIIITSHKSGLMKVWDRETGKQQKVWRSGHKGPVAKLVFDSTDTSIASGGSDGNIRLWDLTHYTCTSSLKGAVGVFTVLKYHPDNSKQLIFGAADDTKIRSWNSKTGKEETVYSGHFSKITSLQFTPDSEYIISSGRDRVLILWKLHKSLAVRTIPVYESIEDTYLLGSAFNIPNFQKKAETEGIYIATVGEKGIVKVWNMQMSRLMYEQKNSLVTPAADEGGLAATHLLFNAALNMLAVVTADHNIIFHNLETFDSVKQMIGFTDEVLDLIFIGADEKHIVVATNSPDLKYYHLESMDCKILKGHTDIVLSLSCFQTKPEMFISSGKDNSIRVWLQESNLVTCIGVGLRHTASVGSVYAFHTSCEYFASVSQDNCVKVWSVPKEIGNEDAKIKSIFTELAHQMDINCVSVSPNDKMIATGSQDKTVKLWTHDLSLLGILKGHRRGIWCVMFSPVDQVVATSSADSTLKLWSIADLSCLKTLEGHESSVLKLEFLSKGQQIMSSGADGLLKLWNIKTSDCKMSLDNHEGKIWSLAVTKDESTVFTGGSDSKLVKLVDVTAERQQEMSKKREEMILLEQELSNLLHNKKMVKALKLALRMERPLQVLKIINEVLKSGTENLSETLQEINDTQKEALLKFATEWNTNNKNCHAAQLVINTLAPDIISGKLKIASLGSFIEGALPYSERHFDRLTNLLQDLNFITYTVNCMQPHVINNN